MFTSQKNKLFDKKNELSDKKKHICLKSVTNV